MNLLLDHLWQSTAILAVIGLLTLCFRNNGAHVRHALWVAASLKFLVPFALLNMLGSYLSGLINQPLPELVVRVVYGVAQPFSDGPVFIVLPAPGADIWLPLLMAWGAGIIVFAGLWLSRWWKLRAVLCAAIDTAIAAPMPVKLSQTLMEPGLVGIFRPVLLLPEDIADKLTPAELQAIISHESCHMRRRDNLTAALHMLVETIFWFFPPVWWLGTRLIAERERACDEAVVASGNDPQVYAESILKVCKHYVSSPLACAAGVSGADLKQRMEEIMKSNVMAHLNIPKKLLLVAAAAVLLALPLALGIQPVPAAFAQNAACAIEPVTQSHTLPPYPVASAKLGETGTVLLQVTIAQDGRVIGARVAQSSGFAALDAAAASHVQQNYLWRPLACASVQTNVRVVFALAQAPAGLQPTSLDPAQSGTPNPGSEALLRRMLNGMASKQPNITEMDANLAKGSVDQKASLDKVADDFGMLRSLTFKQHEGGNDLYLAEMQKGYLLCVIGPAKGGKVSTFVFRQAVNRADLEAWRLENGRLKGA